MEPTLENILKAMQDVYDALSETTLRKVPKDAARSKMAWAITHVKAMGEETKATQAQKRLNPTEENTHLKEIWAELAEIKNAVKQTYAQALQKPVSKSAGVSAHYESKHMRANGHEHGTHHVHTMAQHEPQPSKDHEQDKARSEQAKKDIILTARNASDDAKVKLNTEEEAIKKSLQQLVEQNEGSTTVKIESVRKLAKHVVRIRCHTESDATQVRHINWEETLGGVTVVKTEYGIVLHGVPKRFMEHIEELVAEIERANQIKVKRIAPLIKNARNPDAPTQSIVIFTESLEEANKCIDDQVIIEGRLFGTDRYTPQCQIKQCFNCQAYGHKADICKKKPVCGKCAQEHETRSCASEETKCANCKDAHFAWNHQCPRRKEVSQNMEARKSKIPSNFPC